MTTFPSWIAAGIPTFWRSPTIGPGLKGVTPAFTSISEVTVSPPFAGAFVLVVLILLKILKGLISVASIAVWPVI